jgi:hypothetical protein
MLATSLTLKASAAPSSSQNGRGRAVAAYAAKGAAIDVP